MIFKRKKKKKPPKYDGLPFALPVKKRGEDKKKLEDQLDVLFSEYVRILAKGRCWWCRKQVGFKKLATHHIWTRSSRAGRWNPENSLALCWPCHSYRAHGETETFRDKVIQEMGQDQFDRLMVLCKSRTKYTVTDLKWIMQDLICKIAALKKES